MRIVCLHKEKLEPLVQVGAAIDDLTPKGLWNTQYHIISISEDQLAGLKKLYGESSYQDITPKITSKAATISGGFLYCRGGKVPNGTKLRARYLSQSYEAEVKAGRVWLNQKPYDSPSKAARAITKSAVNGWRWWEYYDEEKQSWVSLDVLRYEQKKSQVAA